MEFSVDTKQRIEKLKTRYPDVMATLLPVLHLAQKEFGYVSPDVEEYVAKYLNLPVTHVHGVATFYTMYNKKPVGKFHVQVCTNIACSLMGSEHIVNYLEQKLGIKAGETTEDNKFTLSQVECLGACGFAPVMQINDDYYEDLTKEKVDEILKGLESQADEKPEAKPEPEPEAEPAAEEPAAEEAEPEAGDGEEPEEG